MTVKEAYNKIAFAWHKSHSSDDWWIQGTDQFITYLTKGASVLDVGCGAGTKTKYLKEKGLNVTGLDFSEKLIEIAKSEIPDTEFVVKDLHDLDDWNQLFDAVFAQAVLLHIPKKEIKDILVKLKNKIKPKGYFYLAVKDIKPDRPEEEIKKENDYGTPVEIFFSYYSLPEMKKNVEDAGFTILYEKVAKSGRSNWVQLIAQKND